MERYLLEDSLQAWNVDGSSDAVAPHCTSWIELLEDATGRRRGKCSFAGCERMAEVGGHLWIKREGCFLAPICKACNHPLTKARWQGAGSRLRENIEVMRVPITSGMRRASRRFDDPRRAAGTRWQRADNSDESDGDSDNEDSNQGAYGACRRCGRGGHRAHSCYANTHVRGHGLTREARHVGRVKHSYKSQSCERCGRRGHHGGDCYARVHMNGYRLADADV